MHSAYLLPLLAALANAYRYDDSAASQIWSPWRRLIGRQAKVAPPSPLDPSAHTEYLCPAVPAGQTQSQVSTILNTTDLGTAQQQLMQWADQAKILAPSEGGAGQRMVTDSVVVMICNMDTQNLNVNSSLLGNMLDQVDCGTIQAPTEGFGQVSIHNQKAEKYYVYYGPASTAGSCMSTTDFDKLQEAQKEPCSNDFQGYACNNSK